MTDLTISISTLVALALLAAALSIVGGVRRGRAGVMLGHGDSVPLHAAMRAQGNLVEVTPFAVGALAAAEYLQALAPTTLGILGAALVGARVIHAVAFLRNNGGEGVGRVIGSAGTLLVTVGLCVMVAAAVVTHG